MIRFSGFLRGFDGSISGRTWARALFNASLSDSGGAALLLDWIHRLLMLSVMIEMFSSSKLSFLDSKSTWRMTLRQTERTKESRATDVVCPIVVSFDGDTASRTTAVARRPTPCHYMTRMSALLRVDMIIMQRVSKASAVVRWKNESNQCS